MLIILSFMLLFWLLGISLLLCLFISRKLLWLIPFLFYVLLFIVWISLPSYFITVIYLPLSLLFFLLLSEPIFFRIYLFLFLSSLIFNCNIKFLYRIIFIYFYFCRSFPSMMAISFVKSGSSSIVSSLSKNYAAFNPLAKHTP